MDIYQTIAKWIKENPTLHSSHVLATIIISLFNGTRQVNLWETFSILDLERTRWALEAIRTFAEQGESPELEQAAQAIIKLKEI